MADAAAPHAGRTQRAVLRVRLLAPCSTGPGSDDLPVVPYVYSSSVDLQAHSNAGLVGVLAVAARGMLDRCAVSGGAQRLRAASGIQLAPLRQPACSAAACNLQPAAAHSARLPGHSDGKPTDVDAMVPLLFTIMDENASPFLAQNMAAAGVPPEHKGDGAWQAAARRQAGRARRAAAGAALCARSRCHAAHRPPCPADAAADFAESNLKHSINGLMYCNLGGLEFLVGKRVRFLLVGMGSEMDLHGGVFAGDAERERHRLLHGAAAQRGARRGRHTIAQRHVGRVVRRARSLCCRNACDAQHPVTHARGAPCAGLCHPAPTRRSSWNVTLHSLIHPFFFRLLVQPPSPQPPPFSPTAACRRRCRWRCELAPFVRCARGFFQFFICLN